MYNKENAQSLLSKMDDTSREQTDTDNLTTLGKKTKGDKESFAEINSANERMSRVKAL